MPRDKQGNKLNWQQYGKRWKQGIEGITPLQMARTTYKSTYIIIIGLILGMVYSIIYFKSSYWLLIVLIGGLINTIIIQIGNYQKYLLLRRIENDE